MRLGQLARKLDLKTDEIVSFLASRGITVEPGNNAKLLDEHAQLVTGYFAPGTTLSSEEMQEKAAEPAASQPEAENIESVVEEEPQQALTENELPEVIRAPKVELAGLKVLGKIELPEKKKKDPEGTTQLDEEAKAPEPEIKSSRRPERRERRDDRNRPNRPQKNPIALQREREQQEAQRKREAQRELEKQRKKEYYLNRVKPGTPTKPARIHKEEVYEMPEPPRPEPRTLWGRFMRWLNS